MPVGVNHYVYVDAAGQVWDPLGHVWGGWYQDPGSGAWSRVATLDEYRALLGSASR